jgi:hypothetical protein
MTGTLRRWVITGVGLAVPIIVHAAPAGSGWTRVRVLTPGTAISITTTDSWRSPRNFLAADDDSVTVLDVTDPTLPRAARHALSAMAARQPQCLLASQGNTCVVENLRVGPDGVFVGPRKIADLEHFVRRLARTDVNEVRGPVRVRGSRHGAILGIWIGSAVGMAFGTQVANTTTGAGILLSATGLGAFLGDRASSHMEERVIYP